MRKIRRFIRRHRLAYHYRAMARAVRSLSQAEAVAFLQREVDCAAKRALGSDREFIHALMREVSGLPDRVERLTNIVVNLRVARRRSERATTG